MTRLNPRFTTPDHPSTSPASARIPAAARRLDVACRLPRDAEAPAQDNVARVTGAPSTVALALALAAGAGTAPLVVESTRRQHCLQAVARITLALVSEADSPAVLRLVMDEGLVLADADEVRITRSGGGHQETLRPSTGLGGVPSLWVTTDASWLRTVTDLVDRTGTVVSDEIASDHRFLDAGTPSPRVGPLIALPLTAGGPATPVLVVTRARGHPPFQGPERDAMTEFCGRVAVALGCARARVDAERLALVHERERIARDVHDHVIGRLVGSGMAVQGVARWITDDAGHRKLAMHLDELDAAIRDLRALIHGLDRDPAQVWSLPARIRQVVDESCSHLGLVPTLDLDPRVDLPYGSATSGHLLAVLREALTNVARHADARTVHITLTGGDSIELTVTDDGRGLPTSRPAPTSAGGHGLANIASRAADAGGTCTLAANPHGGTILRWGAPSTR